MPSWTLFLTSPPTPPSRRSCARPEHRHGSREDLLLPGLVHPHQDYQGNH